MSTADLVEALPVGADRERVLLLAHAALARKGCIQYTDAKMLL